MPKYQSHGYGRQLMDFAENKIAENFSCVHIDSSLPAKEMYLKRRYKEKTPARFIQTMETSLSMMKWKSLLTAG